MQRRPFLASLVGLSTAPAIGTETDDGETQTGVPVKTPGEGAPDHLETCDLCQGPHAVAAIETTTVERAPGVTLDLCQTCQVAYSFVPDDDVCFRCGDAVDEGHGHYFELEHPLGASDVRGQTAGTLCADCAGDFATKVNQQGVHNHEESAAAWDAASERETEAWIDAKEAGGEPDR